MSKVKVGTIGVSTNRKITGLYAPHLVSQLITRWHSEDMELHRLCQSARIQIDECINDLESVISMMAHGMHSLSDRDNKLSVLNIIQELTVKKDYLVTLRDQLSSSCEETTREAIKAFTNATGRVVTVAKVTVSY